MVSSLVVICYVWLLFSRRGLRAPGRWTSCSPFLRGRKRVREFLEEKLQPGTRARYSAARTALYLYMAAHYGLCDFYSPGQQGWPLAEAVMDLRDEGFSTTHLDDVCSAIAKDWPTRRFRIASAVLERIREVVPVRQAPALPFEAVLAMVSTAHL